MTVWWAVEIFEKAEIYEEMDFQKVGECRSADVLAIGLLAAAGRVIRRLELEEEIAWLERQLTCLPG
jgi:hypothetical protein